MDMSMSNPILIQSVVFLVVTGALIALAAWITRRERTVADRISALSRQTVLPNNRRPLGSPVGKGLPQAAEGLLLRNGKQRARLQARFLEAGIHKPYALSLYVAARFGLTLVLPAVCLVGVLLGRLPLAYAWMAIGPAAVLGICLPYMWLERRRARRHLVLRRAIPDFLDLVIACLGGGMSVQAALKQVADELKLAHAELSGELGIVLREIELGGTLDHALQQLAIRTGLEELRTLRSFVQQTTRFGTTITDALSQLAEMLRIQREQRAEELAQKAAVKILFPTMLFIFPTVFVVLAGPAAVQIQEGFRASQQPESESKQDK